jgi:tetratricopeptide (TPR) repeat protein/DNA-binding XRE family transcriptional regulator
MMQAAEMAPQPRARWLLIEARNQRGWSQQEMADLIGTTHVNVSRWERGITRPTPYFRRKLCTLFGKSEQELDLTPMPADTPIPPVAPIATHPSGNAVYDPSIPAPLPMHLVGRDAALERVKARLFAGGSVALSALNGLPGIGKTALSITLAHDPVIRERFRDGVLWAALGPQPDIAGQWSRWGKLLGMPDSEMAALSGSDAWARALRLAIGPRALLLVIDDAWSLEDALACKVGGPNCAHLVTTRFPGLAAYMAFGGAMTLQELSEDEGYELLCQLAPGVVEPEEQMARDLVRAVGGLPLALTLIGNYLRKQAYSGPARRVRAALEHLSRAEARLALSEPQTPAESHASLAPDISLSLQSVIDVSSQQLSQDTLAALYALSVFPPKPASFSEEAALAVAACPLQTLDALLDAGLLESTAAGRYTLHQVIADYARLCLDADAAQAAHARLIACMVDYVEAHRKDYELLEVENSAIHAALEAAYQPGSASDGGPGQPQGIAPTRGDKEPGQPQGIAPTLNRWESQLVRLAAAFAPFLLSRGIYQTAQQHMQRALEAARAINDARGMATALLYLGEIAQKQGDYTRAEASLQEGLTIARGDRDDERISALLTNLGWVSLKRGEYMRAETYLQEGLTIARRLDNRERIAAVLEMLGSVSGSRGDYAQSEAYLQEGLALAREHADRERMCTILINLGVTEGEQGKHAQAEQYFEEGLILAKEIGHREWICALLSNLGEAAEAQEHHAQAEKHFQEGLVLARQLGHREWACALLSNLGLAAGKQGNYSHAQEYFQEGLVLAYQIAIPQLTSNILYAYGNFCLDAHQIETSENIFRQMLSVIPEENEDLISLANYGLARIAYIRGNRSDAEKLGKQSVKILEGMGNREAEEVKRWLEAIATK